MFTKWNSKFVGRRPRPRIRITNVEEEHGDLIPYLAQLKAAFDPNGILNPGKILRIR